MKIILINGPKRSGKDSGAAHLAKALGVVRQGFADELKRGTHGAYGMGHLPFDHFEAVKDDPRPEFYGIEPRKAYIGYSEGMMKPLHGQTIFGKLWVAGAKRMTGGFRALPPAFAVPDSGFAPEAEELAAEFGRDALVLVRLHRPGHDFTGDSRGYIELPGVRTFDLANDAQGDPLPYFARLEAIAREVVGLAR